MTNADLLRLALHGAALADMHGSKPKRLVRALSYQAEDLPAEAAEYATDKDFQKYLESAPPTDPLVEAWKKQLTRWDFAEAPTWSSADARSDERRRNVYELLALEPRTCELLTSIVPVYRTAPPVVISTKFTPWYTSQSQQGRPWYWPAYRELLANKGWPEHAVAGLDIASDRVVERLADPSSPSVYQSKGLVVGYVQSGKTANFTGVIAKAVDAGYRLVIVLGGTLNLLRGQTQRRLDMELVGRENILRGASEDESDYADDPAWGQGKFLKFGGLPSALGAFDIVRMTTRDNDYKSLLQGIVALEFEKQEPALPLYDARNLHRSSARLMVVKKNKTVLTKLVKDLNKIKTPLSEIPVLIVDDESDEASVNTSDLAKPDAERTAINQKISDLLKMLPRAQYVGYTATPFANVFVDPSDTEDIFPKDFIISLPRPDGYMGAPDFHDMDSVVPSDERNPANSNEKAHVRDILVEGDDDDSCLQRAMDMFVLTAAIKLYREDMGGLGDRHFQHHTMLIHESMRTDAHRELLGRVTRLWWNAGYMGSRGHDRLRDLFESDVAPVSAVRADGYSVPASYDEVIPFVGPAAIRISGDDRPIIVVNGDKDLETGEADFDKRSIWKILIGGQKLSRGFTVEGLTVTYFRRRAGSASTLMQMGRWFGFRDGYRDLVRLYLGRSETTGTKEIDLYEAFEAICLDEESFRSELAQYSVMVDGRPQILPAQVPPLVSQHLAWLKPTSPNKMFNARLLEIKSPGEWQEPTAYPTRVADLRHNTALWTPILESLSESPTAFAYPSDKDGTRGPHVFKAFTGHILAPEFFDIISSLKWHAPAQFSPYLTYLREITAEQRVEDWIVLAPQHESGDTQVIDMASGRSFSWFSRDRRRGPLFGAISDPKHRSVPMHIATPSALAGHLSDENHAQTLNSGAMSDNVRRAVEAAENLSADRRGVVVLYPIIETAVRRKYGVMKPAGSKKLTVDPGELVMSFGFVAPADARGDRGRVIRFTAIDSSLENVPIIDVIRHRSELKELRNRIGGVQSPTRARTDEADRGSRHEPS
ncbi:Z1 domain-containing protein [Rhodococcus koreensis]|uniref:Z1 domain-containing protein n=1 Tax=Rhodococcus koreensis TaxID=99653 RepID=A0A1H4ZSB3_9NOCA|nr:Z1 domain-containing protein [Rhodococcus koreensis]SED32364.1 Z1 domain-containing protein [Rhodococcus koreensis]